MTVLVQFCTMSVSYGCSNIILTSPMMINVNVGCCYSSQFLQLLSQDTSPQRSLASCSELRLVAAGNDFDHTDAVCPRSVSNSETASCPVLPHWNSIQHACAKQHHHQRQHQHQHQHHHHHHHHHHRHHHHHQHQYHRH